MGKAIDGELAGKLKHFVNTDALGRINPFLGYINLKNGKTSLKSDLPGFFLSYDKNTISSILTVVDTDSLILVDMAKKKNYKTIDRSILSQRRITDLYLSRNHRFLTNRDYLIDLNTNKKNDLFVNSSSGLPWFDDTLNNKVFLLVPKIIVDTLKNSDTVTKFGGIRIRTAPTTRRNIMFDLYELNSGILIQSFFVKAFDSLLQKNKKSLENDDLDIDIDIDLEQDISDAIFDNEMSDYIKRYFQFDIDYQNNTIYFYSNDFSITNNIILSYNIDKGNEQWRKSFSVRIGVAEKIKSKNKYLYYLSPNANNGSSKINDNFQYLKKISNNNGAEIFSLKFQGFNQIADFVVSEATNRIILYHYIGKISFLNLRTGEFLKDHHVAKFVGNKFSIFLPVIIFYLQREEMNQFRLEDCQMVNYYILL